MRIHCPSTTGTRHDHHRVDTPADVPTDVAAEAGAIAAELAPHRARIAAELLAG
ncbi:hypothetical protein ACFWJ4_07745 [Kitasatospora sp. NPDC127067]|uniref:hypothetical protein n=1 Tax=Kitasatospora sp. NPDC127067 TaxID=3347126 RepID=UPI00364A8BBA